MIKYYLMRGRASKIKRIHKCKQDGRNRRHALEVEEEAHAPPSAQAQEDAPARALNSARAPPARTKPRRPPREATEMTAQPVVSRRSRADGPAHRAGLGVGGKLTTMEGRRRRGRSETVGDNRDASESG